MSSNDSQKLRNCPFCGSEGKLKVADGILDDFTMFYCYCPNGKCIAGGTDWFRSREEAIEAWNTRAERTCTYVEYVDAFGHYYQCLECQYKMDGGEFEHYRPAHCMGCGSKIKAVMER